MINYFQHRWPVLKGQEDTSILISIQPDDLFGDEYKMEEIPAQALGENLYKICAIPLLVHDLNLEDIVKADANRVYMQTTNDGGRYGFRLAVNIPSNHNDIEPAEFSAVVKYLQKKKYNIEFFSHTLIGVDVSDLKSAKKLAAELEKMVKNKLLMGYDTTRL